LREGDNGPSLFIISIGEESQSERSVDEEEKKKTQVVGKEERKNLSVSTAQYCEISGDYSLFNKIRGVTKTYKSAIEMRDLQGFHRLSVSTLGQANVTRKYCNKDTSETQIT
jgi:hypothetical protein